MSTPYSYRVEYDSKMQVVPSRPYETVSRFMQMVRQRFNISFEIELTYNNAILCPDDILFDLHLNTEITVIRVRQRLPENKSAVDTPRVTRDLDRRYVDPVASHSFNPTKKEQLMPAVWFSPNHDLRRQSSLTPVLPSNKSENNIPQQISHSVSFYSPEKSQHTHRFNLSPIRRTTSEKLFNSGTYSFKFNTTTAANTIQKKHETYKKSFYIEDNESDIDKED